MCPEQKEERQWVGGALGRGQCPVVSPSGRGNLAVTGVTQSSSKHKPKQAPESKSIPAYSPLHASLPSVLDLQPLGSAPRNAFSIKTKGSFWLCPLPLGTFRGGGQCLCALVSRRPGLGASWRLWVAWGSSQLCAEGEWEPLALGVLPSDHPRSA